MYKSIKACGALFLRWTRSEAKGVKVNKSCFLPSRGLHSAAVDEYCIKCYKNERKDYSQHLSRRTERPGGPDALAAKGLEPNSVSACIVRSEARSS